MNTKTFIVSNILFSVEWTLKKRKKYELKRCTIWRFRFICPVEARCTWLGPNIWNSKAQKGIRKSWSGNGRKFQIYSHHHLSSRRPLTSFNGYFSLFSLSLSTETSILGFKLFLYFENLQRQNLIESTSNRSNFKLSSSGEYTRNF